MAQEIREFAVLVPAGTPLAAPLTVDVSFPERVVTAVSWRVPPGPSGLMGWALTSAGAPVIPITPGTYLVADDQSDTWSLTGYLDSGNWQVTCYNTGAYPHTLYLTFLLYLPTAAVPPVPPPPGSGAGLIGITGTVASDVSPVPVPASPTTPAAGPVPGVNPVVPAMVGGPRPAVGI